MRKFLAIAVLVAATLGAGAGNATPGPNGKNNHGLCTAYFAGSETGQANKRKAGPFKNLEKAAGVEEGDTPEETEEKVAAFCASATPGGKG